MGIFSTYSGLIYNEFMSMKVPLFSSCYKFEKPKDGSPFPLTEKFCAYPFGFDWIWAQAKNEIVYFNSYRTKLSIIVGVLHMSLGIVFKGILQKYKYFRPQYTY